MLQYNNVEEDAVFWIFFLLSNLFKVYCPRNINTGELAIQLVGL